MSTVSKGENEMHIDGNVNPNTMVSFSAMDQYIFSVVQNMVDDVCLYHAKVDSVQNKYMSQINDLENSADIEEKQVLEEMMKNELESISLRSVPLKVKKEDSKTKIFKSASEIKNEHGIPSGKFGWCIVCRN